tara:strand:+ start:1967 stop:2194 length:228 start_codon:yes stop_codon:yes gene_type:complete
MKENDWWLLLVLVVALLLMTQRWFWAIALFLGMLAAFFTCIASIIHFQIVAAVGFCVLGIIFMGLLAVVVDGGNR